MAGLVPAIPAAAVLWLCAQFSRPVPLAMAGATPIGHDDVGYPPAPK
jgi:hypothetical protein